MTDRTTPALRVHQLRKAFGDVVAVDALDLEVARGECFGLLGPNGAGKTTTIEICEGLLPADSGRVEVLGEAWSRDSTGLRQRLGMQLQETIFGEKLTVEETVRLFRSFYRSGPSVDALLTLVQLTEKRAARVGGLSGGQKQRLSVACALAGDPELVFLDEPTTGLDPQSRRQVWELVERLRTRGCTIVLTTHYMDEAERLCDRVAIVDHGRIIALGTPRELIRSLGTEHVLEVTWRVVPSDRTWCAALPGAGELREAGPVWTIPVAAAHEALPAFLAAAERSGGVIADLRTHAPTLEDLFVHLTGRHLRDG